MVSNPEVKFKIGDQARISNEAYYSSDRGEVRTVSKNTYTKENFFLHYTHGDCYFITEDDEIWICFDGRNVLQQHLHKLTKLHKALL